MGKSELVTHRFELVDGPLFCSLGVESVEVAGAGGGRPPCDPRRLRWATGLVSDGRVRYAGPVTPALSTVARLMAYRVRCRYTCPVSAETTRTAATCSTGIDV